MTGIGGMRHRLVLERAVEAEDGAGGRVAAWETVATLWGAVEEPAGREAEEADAVGGTKRVRVALRHRGDIGPAMRLRLGARVLDIEAVRDAKGERRFLVADCIERDLA